jgi:hypothetical protein
MFNAESAWGLTEELWFNEWEYKGTALTVPCIRSGRRTSTPRISNSTLVVHGQLDYRLDVSEGFQLFTTLQRLGVPSKMLYFPMKATVLKPQNSQLCTRPSPLGGSLDEEVSDLASSLFECGAGTPPRSEHGALMIRAMVGGGCRPQSTRYLHGQISIIATILDFSEDLVVPSRAYPLHCSADTSLLLQSSHLASSSDFITIVLLCKGYSWVSGPIGPVASSLGGALHSPYLQARWVTSRLGGSREGEVRV